MARAVGFELTSVRCITIISTTTIVLSWFGSYPDMYIYYMWEVKHGESIGLTGCKTQIWLHSNMHSSSLIVNVVDTLWKLSYQKHGNTGNCMEAYVTVFLCNNPVKHKFTNSSTIIYHSDLSLKIQISPQSRIDGFNVIGRIGLEGKSLSWDIPLS